MTMRNTIWAACLFSVLLGGTALATTISPTDPNLQYIGRWDTASPSQPWAYAQGSSVIVSFTGTSIAATMTGSIGEFFRVIIDDDDTASVKVSFASGVPTTIASGLAPGTHKLELIKETDIGRATLLGLELDAGATTVPSPPRPSRRIVFYGDSNFAGYSLDSEKDQGSWSLVGCHYGVTAITARMFGAEYQNISRSGATLSSLNSAYDRIDWNTSSPTFDFVSFPVDVVVVNIGANDAFWPEGVNKPKYHTLLDNLRADHPLAQIMLYNSYGWDSNEPANYIEDVIATHGDANMSWGIFPWVFEQYHGCQTEHAGMARILAAHLATITGWSPSEPDVVSGYGQDGNVANGSFEQAAPFGGWGWRYYDGSGVGRILDPAGAYHGNSYLRLVSGASSHQTNPASNGDVIRLSMWLRGSTAGDSVDVSIGFRDQDGGGEFNNPIAQTTETKTLTTNWARYTMEVSAPTNPGNPVYSARVSFVAAVGDSVDIDRVSTGAWSDVGGGTAGVAGQPTLDGSGTLVAGTEAAIVLTQAPPGAAMLLWISHASTPFMALGGTVHAIPYVSQTFLTADAAGELDIGTTWPPGIPPASKIWFQYLVQDFSTIPAITLSNGLQATTP
jgi:lysophospholipase L1-like esterase